MVTDFHLLLRGIRRMQVGLAWGGGPLVTAGIEYYRYGSYCWCY